MKNFSVEVDGKTYWISRSIAVAVFLYAEHDGKLYVLANKRGSGTPDFQGYWNCPCGYLDYDETLKECACREVMEETGVSVSLRNLSLMSVHDCNYATPSEKERQNVTMRLVGVVPYQTNLVVKDRGGEQNEVSEIKFVPISDIDGYKWAFNHKVLIKKFIKFAKRQIVSNSKNVK